MVPGSITEVVVSAVIEKTWTGYEYGISLAPPEVRYSRFHSCRMFRETKRSAAGAVVRA